MSAQPVVEPGSPAMPQIPPRPAVPLDRLPGARCGRLVGQAMSGVRFEDGTLLFAARWAASPAGAYTEVFRFEPDGRRCLIVDTARGEQVAHWLHRFDVSIVTAVEWQVEGQHTRVRWMEQDEAHELSFQRPFHVGYALASMALRRTPERWLLRAGVARLGARLLGPALGIGSTPFSGKTETGVPVHLLARDLGVVLHASYRRGGRSAGDAVPYEGGVPLGELSFTRRPTLARGELFYVPPPVGS